MRGFVYFVLFILMSNTHILSAQIKKENFKFGLSYGSGTQNRYPYKLSDHMHTVNFYKAQLNYRLKQKRKWAYEINLEPNFNVVRHQLIDASVINGKDGDNYLELREHYAQRQDLKEYVLNIGIIMRYYISKDLSSYAIGSMGPMIGNKATERLAKGFAFSDVFGIGLSFQIGKTTFDFRYSMRHTSNLNFKMPNKGHNTMNMEYAVLFHL
ncbi:acyloxyacyl hydrolase [Tamlana crocina]